MKPDNIFPNQSCAITSNYSITPDGRIISTIGHTKELKPSTTKNGTQDIVLTINGRRKHYMVSYLVAEAYIPNPNNYPNVIHKDGNVSNNNVENLEWSLSMDGHKR